MQTIGKCHSVMKESFKELYTKAKIGDKKVYENITMCLICLSVQN